MAHDRLDDEDMPGYFLPEDSQFRLAKLRDHVRFLVRLALPRTQAEERAAEPKVRMGELALCLELLADQVDLVLDALSYPAQRTDTMRDAWSDATAQPG
ncbi:XAC0095 family protein, partial [Pseudoxanthomonas kalamensis]|uniref:XAC0095 family protein n=1 Tax=Pseudoxanthomonas kalamensis TaxID=289483 RepID=UPI003CCCEAE6